MMEEVVTTRAIRRQIVTTNKPSPSFLRARCLSVTQLTESKHWREKVLHSLHLLTQSHLRSSNLVLYHWRLLVTLQEDY